MNVKYDILLIVPLALLLSGCYKDSVKKGDKEIIDIELPKVTIDHNLIGQVTDQNMEAVVDYTINYDGRILFPVYKSYFQTRATAIDKYHEILFINTANSTIPYTTPMIENESNFVNFIYPTDWQQNQISADNLSLQIADLTIKFDSNFLPSNSQLKVNSTSLINRQDGVYPGGIFALENGERLLLKSEKIFILDSKDAQDYKGKIDASVSLWIFNLEKGLWLPTHEIIGNGVYAVGEAVDYQEVTGYIKKEGQGVLPKSLLVDGQIASVSQSGKYLAYIEEGKLSTTLNLYSTTGCQLDRDAAISNGLAQDFLISKEEVTTLSINPIDCDFNVVKDGLIFLTNAKDEVISFGSLDEELAFFKCIDQNAFTVKAISSNGEHSPAIKHRSMFDIEMYDIFLCDQLPDEYVYLQIDGQDVVWQNIEGRINDENDLIVSYRDSGNNSGYITISNGMRAGLYEDFDLNALIEAMDLAESGYMLDCTNSTEGCGFSIVDIYEYGGADGDYVRMYFEGRFWMKTFRPELRAGYKNMKGVINLIRRF